MNNPIILVLFNIILLVHVAHFESLTEKFGPVHLQAKIKTLPEKYGKLNVNDKRAARKMIDFAEKLRKVFPEGYKSMPPLDPWVERKMKPLDFSLPSLWLHGKLYLKNFEMVGLQNFSLDSLETRLNSLRTDLEVSLPLITIDTDFEVDATLAFVPMRLSGHIRCIFKNLHLSGGVGSEKKKNNSRKVFQVTSANFKAKADSVQVHVSNMNIGDELASLGNEISIERWINTTKDEAAQTVLNDVIKTINKALRGYSADRIQAFLLSKS